MARTGPGKRREAIGGELGLKIMSGGRKEMGSVKQARNAETPKR